MFSRRDLLKFGGSLVAGSALGPGLDAISPTDGVTYGATATAHPVERWDLFEASLPGPSSGNPFVDVTLEATFKQGSREIHVRGFYDGDGTYRVRFMPTTVGEWTYTTTSNHPKLNGQSGVLVAGTPSAHNHGPVQVKDRYHFIYADGSPYRELGTTCYAWTSQPEALEKQTIETLRTAPFNKLRMCVFPKWFDYNRVEPPLYPFAGTAPDRWDFTRLNPAYFQHLEARVRQLRDLGIEADLILFHPYDEGHWGFDRMGAENDHRYLNYVVARLAAYRNVWWSLANEWDYFKTKTAQDFEQIGELIAKNDPYRHMCSIHNQQRFFDHSRPWISHVSVQNDNPANAETYIAQYGKPVIFDECRYEGDIPQGWGDITAERLVGNFWKTLVEGAFCGHGETYLNARQELWWSKGGVLVGRSPSRLAFFKKIIDDAPPGSSVLKQPDTWGIEGQYYLTYLWDRQHATQAYQLPEQVRFQAEILDTLAMTITRLPKTYSGATEVKLPVRPYLAIRVTRI